jgi:phosphoglycerate dehydrogenase-like enzyme
MHLMKIILIGEAANHRETLSTALNGEYEIVGLPREAAQVGSHDHVIAADDVVVSLRFRREDGAPDFRMLHVPGAGLDGIDFAAIPASCTVCNVFEHETAIAEFVLLAMLEWQIKLGEMRASFTRESWSPVYRARVPHGEILGRRLGLIGFGRIGRAIASRAKAFGMSIIAVDAMATDTGGLADKLLTPDRLPEMLAASDFVAIACPLTDGTRGLINATTLNAMKPSAVLINISRAEIADEGDLHAALESRTIAGAFLDVWYRYPTGATEIVTPSRFDFHALPNIYATPHSSAWTDALPARRYGVIAENIRRLVAGEPLLNLVRSPAGAQPQRERQA